MDKTYEFGQTFKFDPKMTGRRWGNYLRLLARVRKECEEIGLEQEIGESLLFI